METVPIQEKIQKMMMELREDEHIERLFTDASYLSELMKIEAEYKDFLLSQEHPLQLTSVSPTDYTFDVFVTPSSRIAGEWQVTLFQKGEPMGHQEYETFQEAVTENVTDWFNQALWVV